MVRYYIELVVENDVRLEIHVARSEVEYQSNGTSISRGMAQIYFYMEYRFPLGRADSSLILCV